MCGIFAYIGKRNNAAEIVLDGLKRLEYRGYDSWGVAVKNNDKFLLEKHVGKINSSKTSLPASQFGIGHTRWATHGEVTKQNAHPQLDCSGRISVVHNGIVENDSEIRQMLTKKGHKFVSETDTEVICHLVEEYSKTHTTSEAVRKSFALLEGLNAIVVGDANTNEIIIAKNGSPIVIGKAEAELIAASDASAIIPHTRNVVFLEDNQMAVINDKLSFISIATGKPVKADFTKLDWKIEESNMGNFKHYLVKEINEQPHVIESSLPNYKQDAVKLASLIKNARGTFMLGCGSASYAAMAGTYLFSRIAETHINFSIGSEFSYIEDYLSDESLLIPISQSGETIDVIHPVLKAKLKKAKIAAITNVLGSTLFRTADHKFLLGAGIEKAVVSTKAFIAMYSFLLLTAYTLAGKQNEGLELLLKASENIKKILKKQESIKKTVEILKDKEHVFVIGRGLSYAAAHEASLKLKETAYVHAEGFAGGELKHGVIALIEKGTPVIVMASNDETYQEIISNAQQIKARGGIIIGIGPKNHPIFNEFIATDDIGDATFISQIVISQLLAYNLALLKGIKDPDKPRNLAKSVTVK